MSDTRKRVVAALVTLLALGAALVYVVTSDDSTDGTSASEVVATPTHTPTPSSSAGSTASTPPSSGTSGFELEITRVCAVTVHQPLGDSPSHIVWTFSAPGLAEGTPVTVTSRRLGTDVDAEVTDREIVVKMGVPSYGSYPFPEVAWDDASGSASSISADGNHTVDKREGKASRTCVQ